MDKEIRILIVDDSDDDAELIVRELQKKNFAHTSKWVKSRDEFLASFRDYTPDVILCDYKMPSLGAPEALEIVKERFPAIPFIVVSGTIGEEIAVEMIKSGVVDYVMKDKLIRLVPAIQRAVKEAEEHAERAQLKVYQDIGLEVLQILNEPGDLRDLIPHVLDVFKTRIGLDAVGMRLREGDDFPYFTQKGFSKDFLLTENTLVERGAGGGVCYDKNGNISLECSCGLVLSGKTDPSNPLFTRGGSFWVNDSFPLLELPSDQDPRRRPRNQCIHQGYASVVLVPIRMKNKIVGLLQFNDRRKHRFPLVVVEQIESIAAHIGETLIRKQTEETILKSEERLRDIMSSMADWVWEVDKHGVYTYSSDKVSGILGISAEEVLGKTPFDFMSPEEAQRVAAIFSRIMADKAPLKDIENWNVGKDGKKVCLLTNAVPLLDPKGDLQGYRGVDKDITERKAMEDSLRQSEEKYRSMVDNISIGVAMIGPGMEVLFLNNQMSKWYPHLDLKDKHICYRAFNNPPQEGICSYCPTAKTLKDGLVHEAVTETPMNGKLFNYKVISSPIKDDQGRVVAAIEMVEDITEQKQAEKALRESHVLLSSLAERAPGILYQFKMFPDGRTSMPFASASLFTRLGLTPEELQKDASKLYKVIHPEDFEKFLSSIQESVRTLTEWRHEFRVILPNGAVAWYRASSSPERLPDQSILWHGFFWDITERKQTEAALLEEKMKAQRYFEAAAVIMIVLSKEGKISLINKKGCEILGYQKEELEGVNWFDRFVPENARNEVRERFCMLMKEEEIPSYRESVITNKNGEERLIAWRSTLLKDNRGEVVSILSSGEDITERKKAAEMLEKSEKKFRILFENSHDAILTLEPPSWKFTSGNQAALDMFMAKSEADLSSCEPWALSPERQPDGRPSPEKAKEMLEKVMREGPSFFEWTHKRLNGEEFPVTVSLAKSEVEGKAVLQATIRDMTPIKRLEKEMKRRLNELEIFYKASIGREERIIELKNEIENLKQKLGK